MSFLMNIYRYVTSLIHTTFDGTNEYVTMGDVLDFSRTDSFSVSFWFNPSTVATSFVVCKRASIAGWACSINTNKLQFILNGTTSGRRIIARGNTVLSTSTWYHVLITYDGSEDIGGVNFYINSSAETITTIDNDLLAEDTTNSDPLTIGDKSGTGTNFHGKIDKVVIYNDVVTSGEATTIYNYGRKAGLIGIGNEVSQWELDTLNPSDEIGSNDGTSTNMDSSNIVVG